MGIISTTREMRRVIRKHSISLKREERYKENVGVELPPLKMRKGKTSVF